MDKRAIKEVLLGLNTGEAQVLYWKCHRSGLNESKIAAEIRRETPSASRGPTMSSNWVYQRAVAIEGKLKVIGVESDIRAKTHTTIPREVCSVMHELSDLLPRDEMRSPDWTKWPPVTPEDTTLPSTLETSEIEESPRTIRSVINLDSRVLLAVPVVLLLIVAGAVLLSRSDDPGPTATGETPDEEPDEAARATGGLPGPSGAPLSTELADSTDSAGATVYYADFSDGVDETLWNIQSEDYNVVDGRLVASERLNFAVPGGDWTNFEIVIDIHRAPGHQDGNYVCVRCTERDSVTVEFGDGPWSGTRAPEVFVTKSGSKTHLKYYYRSSRDSTLRIRVDGDQYDAWMNDLQLIDYRIEADSGPIIISINQGTSLESIRVERLD